MAARRGVVLAFALALTFAPAAGAQAPKNDPKKPEPALDPHGDPLPAGARARLGTVRFRIPDAINTAALSPDGKALAVANYQTVLLLDTATGRELRQLSGAFNGAQSLAYSPDGKILACVTGANRVQLWDTATGKSAGQTPQQDKRSRPVGVSFSGDGKLFAVGSESFNQQAQGAVVVYDTAGKEIRSVEPIQNYRVYGALSHDGKRLITWGQYLERGGNNDQTRQRTIQLWNMDDGKEVQKYVIDQANVASAAIAPDGKTVAATSGGATVYVFDAASGKELRRVAGRRGLGGSLLFSPDGKQLAAGGFDGVTQVWEVASGKRLGVCQGPASRLSGLAFTAAGLRGWGADGQAVAIWEAPSGKLLTPQDGHLNRVNSLVFAAGGKKLLSTSFDGRILTWDAATGKRLGVTEIRDDDPRYGYYPGGARQMALVLSADGKYALGGHNYGGMCRLWEVDGAKAVCDFEGARNEGTSNVFSPDGSLVAVASADRVARIWGTNSGELLHQVKLGDTRFGGGTGHVAFAPDGSKLALAQMVYDPNTGQQSTELVVLPSKAGKELFRLKRTNSNPGAVAFSHDGKWVATAGYSFTGQGAVELFDSATGKEAGKRLEMPQAGVMSLAFSPDGRTVAAGMQGIRVYRLEGPPGGVSAGVIVWELATGQVRAKFGGHNGMVTCLAYSPDGRTLASGSQDTTILLWDLTGAPKSRAGKSLTEQELSAVWEDLQSASGERGFQAMVRLQGVPEQAAALLKKQLQPAKASGATADDVAKLVEQMNDKKFAVRTKAQKQLEELGESVIEPLRKALMNPTSNEQRHRIEKILQTVERTILSADEVRVVRAVEVLEYLATPEARAVLTRLSQGAAGARQTRAARAALARLDGKR